jgi:hypothetical protein
MLLQNLSNYIPVRGHNIPEDLSLERKLLQPELPLESRCEALKTVYLTGKETYCTFQKQVITQLKRRNKETSKQTNFMKLFYRDS